LEIKESLTTSMNFKEVLDLLTSYGWRCHLLFVMALVMGSSYLCSLKLGTYSNPTSHMVTISLAFAFLFSAVACFFIGRKRYRLQILLFATSSGDRLKKALDAYSDYQRQEIGITSDVERLEGIVLENFHSACREAIATKKLRLHSLKISKELVRTSEFSRIYATMRGVTLTQIITYIGFILCGIGALLSFPAGNFTYPESVLPLSLALAMTLLMATWYMITKNSTELRKLLFAASPDGELEKSLKTYDTCYEKGNDDALGEATLVVIQAFQEACARAVSEGKLSLY